MRRRLAAFAVAAAAIGGLAVTTVASPSVVDAASTRVTGDPHSPVVAVTAAEALVRYDRFLIAPSSFSLLLFASHVDRVATVTAFELGLDPDALQRAWAATDISHQVAVLAALSQLGVEYRYSSSEPGVGFDCSGLTAFAWRRAGRTLTNQSSAQIDAAAPRDAVTARAGDLVQYPGHVMLYLGVDGAIVHAANQESDVELSFISEGRSVRFGNPA